MIHFLALSVAAYMSSSPDVEVSTPLPNAEPTNTSPDDELTTPSPNAEPTTTSPDVNSTTPSPEAEYNEAMEVVEHQYPLQAEALTDLNAIAKDGMLEFTTWSRHELSSGVQKYDTWLTIPEDFTANMIDAIEKMSFTDVHVDLPNRINQHLGMALDTPEKRQARKIWKAKLHLKQAQPGKDNVGVFRPCLESWDFTKTACKYIDPSESYPWAQNWAKTAWTKGPGSFPWTGDGYTFDWGKNFEFTGVSAPREKPVGSQEYVVIGSGDEGAGTEMTYESSYDPVIYFCEACIDAKKCQNLLSALKVATKDQCSNSASIHV